MVELNNHAGDCDTVDGPASAIDRRDQMVIGLLASVCCIVYFLGLLALARFGDRTRAGWGGYRAQTVIYVLGCCIQFSSLFYYGFVDLVATRGLAFIAIAAGPVVLFSLLYPLLARMAVLVKAQNITSMADFIGARYGKNAWVAAAATVLVTIASVIFLAFQIKIIAGSLALFLVPGAQSASVPVQTPATTSGLVALLMAGFALALGARRIDASGHQRGLMLVIAAECAVKIAAFVVVGGYVTWGMFDGLGDLAARSAADPVFQARIIALPPLPIAVLMVLVSIISAIVWPQQFMMVLVENDDIRAIRHAAWFVPLYALSFIVFVLPVVVAAHVIFPGQIANLDLTILMLPLHAGSTLMALIALIGGLSASTASAFVVLVSLSVMHTNDLVMPVLLRIAALRNRPEGDRIDLLILRVRRLAIIASVAVAYLCFCYVGEARLSLAVNLVVGCILQIATVCIGGLIWQRATARGAVASLTAGGLVWVYTLLLPLLAPDFEPLGRLVAQGPFGIGFLRPTALFGLRIEPMGHGVLLSAITNILAFVGFSLTRQPNARERQQAQTFVRAISSIPEVTGPDVTIGELEATVARYLGDDQSVRSFAAYRAEQGIDANPKRKADGSMLQFSEHLIASAVGAASSRLVVSLLSKRSDLPRDEALRFVDQVSMENRKSRDFLQRAVDFAEQGMAIFDRNFVLVAWNQAARDIFGIPMHTAGHGVTLEALIRSNADRGIYGEGDIEHVVETRRQALLNSSAKRVVSRKDGRIYESRVVRMPDVGLFIIYNDATDQARSEDELAAENETLERRVRERTEELLHLNAAFAKAKAEAEEANLSKTRFLAAASHDLLQPLNAARLYATSLTENMRGGAASHDQLSLAVNVGSSLEAVEDILTALLDISRLDAGVTETEIRPFHLQDTLDQLMLDFGPIARDKGLSLSFMPSTLPIVSDRRLLRRMLQNLVSNAIKYTTTGRVIVGVKRAGANAHIQVWDTGMGIAKSMQREIFREFNRLPSAALIAPGVGLGLSIVERLGRVLGHDVVVRSKPGRGSIFSITVPRAMGLVSVAPPSRSTPDSKLRSLDGLVVAAVDNEPTILSGLTALLGGWGCTVVTGFDFDKIKIALERHGVAPDVIVADYHLDIGDGLTTIGALRMIYGSRHAVLVTADRSAYLRDMAYADDIRILNKPLKPAALRSLLSQWRMMK